MKNERYNPQATRFVFEIEKKLKSYTIYKFVQSDNNTPNVFNELVRIENYRGYSNAKGIDYCFRTKNTTNWSKSKQITGLWYYHGIFYGDDNRNRKSLMIISLHGKYMVLDYFKGYYPETQIELIDILEKNKVIHQYIDISPLNDLKSMQLDLSDKDNK